MLETRCEVLFQERVGRIDIADTVQHVVTVTRHTVASFTGRGVILLADDQHCRTVVSNGFAGIDRVKNAAKWVGIDVVLPQIDVLDRLQEKRDFRFNVPKRGEDQRNHRRVGFFAPLNDQTDLIVLLRSRVVRPEADDNRRSGDQCIAEFSLPSRPRAQFALVDPGLDAIGIKQLSQASYGRFIFAVVTQEHSGRIGWHRTSFTKQMSD